MDQIDTNIGFRLRQAREAHGLTLRDIATSTKISMTSLRAMERNDFARLPGGVFRRAYVKSFAAEVGLNVDELVREYRAAFEPDPPAVSLAPPDANWTNALRPAFRWLALLAIIAGILICGSLILQRARVADEASGEQTPSGVEPTARFRLTINTGSAPVLLFVSAKSPTLVPKKGNASQVH